MTTVKADIAAADRVLTAAVRKARREIAEGGVETGTVTAWCGLPGRVWMTPNYDREAVLDMLTAATIAADVLLEERP